MRPTSKGLPFPILHLQYTPYTFRVATVDDIPEIDKLFRETVLTVNRRDYTEEEVKDWASCSTPKHLEELISNLYFIVALDARQTYRGHSIAPQRRLFTLHVCTQRFSTPKYCDIPLERNRTICPSTRYRQYHIGGKPYRPTIFRT